MGSGRIAKKIKLSEEPRGRLGSFASSRNLPNAQVQRARIVLMAAQGVQTIHIAAQLRTTREKMGKGRQRFIDRGLEGLYDELRPGRPRSVEDERVAALIRKTLDTKPFGGTHWSCRTMAKEIGVSKSTVQRVWNAFGLAASAPFPACQAVHQSYR